MSRSLTPDGKEASSTHDYANAAEKANSNELEYAEYERLCTIYAPDSPEKKKLLRKVDFRVLSVLTLVYLMAYIDRSNVGNAALFGLRQDLKLSGQDYNNVLMVFFFTYALFDIPSAIFLKRAGPPIYVATVMTGFGLVTMLTAWTHNFAGIVACRLVLGIFESGLFPGVVFILSFWYSKWELQLRISIFYAGASASGAFAGLLAYAIANLDNVRGWRAWRYIYLIEGAATLGLGLVAYWLVADTPAKAKWLTEEERAFLTLRQKYAEGKTATSSKFEWRYVKQALVDWKGWCGCILFWGTAIPVYGLSFTMPTVMRNLGFSAARAQGMTAPPYIFAAITAVVVSVFADRKKQRGYVMAGAFAVATCGYIILISTAGKPHLTGVTLFGVFVTAAGLYSATPPMMAWFANNIAGETKRSVSIAIIPTIGQFGGIVGSQIYLVREAPRYPVGFGVSLAVVFLFGICMSLGLRFTLARINANRDKMSEAEVRAKYTDEELTEMGDKSPLYRYVL